MKHRHNGKYRSRTPRGRVIFKRRPTHNHTLKKRHRKLFQQLDKENFETGGYLDFNKEGLEKADVYMGKSSNVDIVLDPDYEVNFHTHPMTGDRVTDKLNYFPSKEDIEFTKAVPSQTMVVLHGGRATIAREGKNFRVNKKKLDMIDRKMEKDAHKMTIEQLFRKYIPEYKKMGLYLKHIKNKGSIKIPLEVVEPVKQRAKKRVGSFFDDEIEKDEEDFAKIREREEIPDEEFFADSENVEAMNKRLEALDDAALQLPGFVDHGLIEDETQARIRKWSKE